MAKRIDTGKAHKAPYTLVSAGLLGSAFFFAFLLWQGGAVQGPRHGLGDYAPGLRCAADVVRAVRVVPLAGASLRSPSVSIEKDYAANMAY